MILRCNIVCASSEKPCAQYQNETYGVGYRVYTLCNGKDPKVVSGRCTVCGVRRDVQRNQMGAGERE